MDRLDELKVLIAILDGGSLAAAAKRLHRSPASVTRALAALEERVGVRLVERSTHSLAPTQAGQRLAEHARLLLGEYGAALGDATDNHDAPLRGLLRVTAPTVFGRRHVTPVVAAFLEVHPEIRVDLVLTDRNVDLIEEGFGVAIRIGRLAESRLVARRIGEVRRVLIASPVYLARRGKPRRPSDLDRHDIVICSVLSLPAEWRFKSGSGREQIVRLTPRLMHSDVEGMLVAVRSGTGIGRCLSYQVFDELASGTLVRILPTFEPPAFPVQLVVTTARHMPRSVRAFIDHAARRLSVLRVIQQ